MVNEILPTTTQTTLNRWLEEIVRKNKADYLLELEMWVKCFDRFFRAQNLPSDDGEIKSFLLKDFKEELTIVRDVALRMSVLASEVISQDRSNLIQFDNYVSTHLKSENIIGNLLHRMKTQPTPDDSLALLLESLTDLRCVMEELIKNSEITFKTFTSMGKLINREIKQCRYIEILVAHKFKVQYDRVDNAQIAAFIKRIQSESLRQDLAKVFLEMFRLLRYLEFIERDLEQDRPLKKALLIFSLVNSELRMLFDFMESRICKLPGIPPGSIEILDSTIFALSQELKKVFSHELVGLVYLRHAPPIFAKVENSHGLLKNSLQQSMVRIAQAFESSFDGRQVFSGYVTRLDQSHKLLQEISLLIGFVKQHEHEANLENLPQLIKRFQNFREGGLKYLMFKDWEEFENFAEEVVSARDADSLRFGLHRFGIFLEALHSEVSKRAVLHTAIAS
ncbi:MAG: hypothetical protein U0V70_19895 [Terriglobia bacterium]